MIRALEIYLARLEAQTAVRPRSPYPPKVVNVLNDTSSHQWKQIYAGGKEVMNNVLPVNGENQKRSLLVVDDNPTMRLLLKHVLKTKYQVETAS